MNTNNRNHDKSLVARYRLLEGILRDWRIHLVCCICVERKKNIMFLCGHGHVSELCTASECLPYLPEANRDENPNILALNLFLMNSYKYTSWIWFQVAYGYRYHENEIVTVGRIRTILAGKKSIWTNTQSFCIKTRERGTDYDLIGSPGQYCILKKGDCPKDFNKGSIRWDDENSDNQQLSRLDSRCGIVGTKANYRAGVDGKHDLRVFESTNGGVRHVHTPCDGCNQESVVGFRWHCLNCPTYDLCTTCYMTDIHDISHRFERIDKSQGERGNRRSFVLNILGLRFRSLTVSVGARQGSIKLEARGMFKGAKVVSGPDWEWKESEGGSGIEGEVTEITGWNDESKNDAVRVAWKKGPRENIYRLGNNGKVDLKCTVPVVGGFYYRDHIPLLMVEFKKSQSGFTTGDKVYLQQLNTEKLQGLSAGHGEWNTDMEKFIGKVGVVQDFTANGDVLVEYPDRRWRYNPTVLTKVREFKRGDEVTIKSDKNLVKELQTEHGGWNEAMISILGRTGKVLEVHGNGDLVTLVDGDRWMLIQQL
ncbi:E3 ubiquitin-protein ligase mib2 [Desmophyllum pertusum]|uniref:E3 ubiquitin-protein ligase mib2 n=1 Tax=Desmophyllum pertusum TaxID=174260 RepID=A0A9X0A026_9CNID|nr:E3 ubiquitin-protein ligase mib2 [Desmophyllum pertusum]